MKAESERVCTKSTFDDIALQQLFCKINWLQETVGVNGRSALNKEKKKEGIPG